MAQLKSIEIFSKNHDQADNTIHDVSGEWTIGKLKLEIRSCLKKENFSVYFHNGVEIEFDDETLLGQLFGPEIINEQGVAQVDVFLPSAALVTIKSEQSEVEGNFEILEESGVILSLEVGPENSKTVDLKRIGKWNDFPAKLRVVISNRANTVLVRHYEIKQKCHMVEIKANGDIWCDDQPRLAAKEGTVMQFHYNQKYWKKAKNSHFLPETVHISPTTATKFWAKEKSVVQNALLCCKAAYHENPESYMASIENRFPAGSYECIYLDNIPQKCVLAFCNETSTLYIAFRGSVNLDDWLVNLNVQSRDYKMKGSRDFSPKVHTGFHKRAKEWIDDKKILNKITEWNPKRIITTGHSLGAATSSMVHIMLVLKLQSEAMKSLECHNIGFATPLFGNLDLKKAILAHPDPRLRNMYHFVNCDDIVPAVSIIEDVYANLTTGVSFWANVGRSKFLRQMFYWLGVIDLEEDEVEQLEIKVENLMSEVNERKNIRDPMFENRGPETYMPIGHYLFMKKKVFEFGQSDLHVFEFEESIEKSEHQWVGQILVKSLEILGDLKVRRGFNKELTQKILSAHDLGNYFTQVADCLTSGIFDQWKLATDLGAPQQNGDS